jgi:hypothetical protein
MKQKLESRRHGRLVGRSRRRGLGNDPVQTFWKELVSEPLDLDSELPLKASRLQQADPAPRTDEVVRDRNYRTHASILAVLKREVCYNHAEMSASNVSRSKSLIVLAGVAVALCAGAAYYRISSARVSVINTEVRREPGSKDWAVYYKVSIGGKTEGDDSATGFAQDVKVRLVGDNGVELPCVTQVVAGSPALTAIVLSGFDKSPTHPTLIVENPDKTESKIPVAELPNPERAMPPTSTASHGLAVDLVDLTPELARNNNLPTGAKAAVFHATDPLPTGYAYKVTPTLASYGSLRKLTTSAPLPPGISPVYARSEVAIPYPAAWKEFQARVDVYKPIVNTTTVTLSGLSLDVQKGAPALKVAAPITRNLPGGFTLTVGAPSARRGAAPPSGQNELAPPIQVRQEPSGAADQPPAPKTKIEWVSPGPDALEVNAIVLGGRRGSRLAAKQHYAAAKPKTLPPVVLRIETTSYEKSDGFDAVAVSK